MTFYKNPFPPTDPDRHQLWQMLVERDIIAFCAQNWDMVSNDFIPEQFMAINGRNSPNPDSWKLDFSRLAAYRDYWLSQAAEFAKTEWADDPERAIYEATTLRDIDIQEDGAILHKKFDGSILKKNGEKVVMNWQTLYTCRKVNGSWKIVGFIGYLPHPMGFENQPQRPAKSEPPGAAQHITAGPYSPVLQINPGQLVVISGQASLDQSGKVIGDTIEEQTRKTLENCQKQLETAGCSLNDVFKVNVYLTDLDNWPRFNEVYKTYFKAPLPVRTAVQTPLLMTLLVEIEMWAIKK